MRKLFIAVVLIALVALPGFTLSLELGVSGTPAPTGQNGKVEAIVGFHLGVSPWAILYASWDSLVMPPGAISGMTSHVDPDGNYVQGKAIPGYLNLIDAGIRIIIANKVVIFVQGGTNLIHVYAPNETVGVKLAGSFGANLRVGLGLKFNWWGISASGTTVFSSFESMGNTLKSLVPESTRKWALEQIVKGLVPSFMAMIYI